MSICDSVFKVALKNDADHDVDVRVNEPTISLDLNTPDELRLQRSPTFSEALLENAGGRIGTMTQFIMRNDSDVKKMRMITLAVCLVAIVGAISLTFLRH